MPKNKEDECLESFEHFAMEFNRNVKDVFKLYKSLPYKYDDKETQKVYKIWSLGFYAGINFALNQLQI